MVTRFSLYYQARLHNIILSGANTSNSVTEDYSEYPWMADGVGLPPNASNALRDLVISLSL